MSRAYAVLTAAGAGTRLGSQGPKALVPLVGEPLVLRAARGLAEAGVDVLVITVPETHLAEFTSLFPLEKVPGFHTVLRVIAGSSVSRQASVAKGLAALETFARDIGLPLHDDSVVLVHDAARCLTPPELITRVIDAVDDGYPAVIPGLPLADTVKTIARGGGNAAPRPVTSTPNRADMVAVQTPQGFTWEVLRAAHEAGADLADSERRSATDDAGLVEANGGTVHVVAGDSLALKITTPLDVALAKILLCR